MRIQTRRPRQPARRVNELEHPDPLRCSKKDWPPIVPRSCRVAAFLRRSCRLCRLRHHSLRRTPAQPAAGRSRVARSLFRLLRSHGHLRPHHQDDRRGRPCPRTRIQGQESKSARTTAAQLPDSLRRVDRLVERLQQGVADLQLTDIAPSARRRLPYPIEFRAGRVRGGGREMQGIHQGRRYLPGRAQPAAADGNAGPAIRHLSDAARRQPSPFMFYLKPGRCAWSVRRRRSWCRVEGE